MSDPFRTGLELPCPSCQQPLLIGDPQVCPRGCGEWIDAKLLEGCDLGGGWAERGAPCVYCKRPMEYVSWNWVVFDRCPQHGAWLEEAQRAVFHAFLERRAGLAASEPPRIEPSPEELELDRLVNAPRELARRVLALERALAELRHGR